MARRKNPNPVRRHYSRDLKRRVIHQAYTLGHSSTEIAIHLDMPLRVVQRVRKVWSEIGEVCKDRTRMGRAPIMSSDSVKVNQTISYVLFVFDHFMRELVFGERAHIQLSHGSSLMHHHMTAAVEWTSSVSLHCLLVVFEEPLLLRRL